MAGAPRIAADIDIAVKVKKWRIGRPPLCADMPSVKTAETKGRVTATFSQFGAA
jgi:hypothetical protein